MDSFHKEYSKIVDGAGLRNNS
jgi:hypothetical protein